MPGLFDDLPMTKQKADAFTFDDLPVAQAPDLDPATGMPAGMVLDPSTGRVIDTAARDAVMAHQGQDQSFSGSILPFSKDAAGNVSFDSDAGLLGALKSAVTLPGDVYTGKVDPNSDEAIRRSLELAALASPVNPAVRIGDRAIPGASKALQRQKPKIPTAQELKSASASGYDRVRDAGVDYTSESVGGLASALRSGLEADGMLAEVAPKTHKILKRLQSPPDGSVAPIASVEAARRSFKNAARNFNNPTDQEAARRVVAGLDDFIERSDPATVVAGPAAEAGRLLKDARGNYAAFKRSDKITGIGEAAELRAAVANSGQNLDNSTRQRLASLLLDPKKIAGYSGPERAAIEQTARGKFSTNRLRDIGNLLGGGGGLGATISGALGGAAGAAAGGVPGALVGGVLVPGLGAGAKKIAAAMTQKGLRGVDEMTRMRSPLYQSRKALAPVNVVNADQRSALIRALLEIQQN